MLNEQNTLCTYNITLLSLFVAYGSGYDYILVTLLLLVIIIY